MENLTIGRHPYLTLNTLIDWLAYQLRKGTHPEQITFQLGLAE